MSDTKVILSNTVKICRQILDIMSHTVIICLTLIMCICQIGQSSFTTGIVKEIVNDVKKDHIEISEDQDTGTIDYDSINISIQLVSDISQMSEHTTDNESGLLVNNEREDGGEYINSTHLDTVELGDTNNIYSDEFIDDTSSKSGEYSELPLSVIFHQIQPYSDCIGEYVALEFNQAYNGPLTIVGLGNGSTARTLTVSVVQSGIWYITNSLSGVLSENIAATTSMSLTDAGEQLSIMISGEVHDIIHYSKGKRGTVLTYTDLDPNTEVRLFTTQQPYTLRTICSTSAQQPIMGSCRISVPMVNYSSGIFHLVMESTGADMICEQGKRKVNDIVLGDGCAQQHIVGPGVHRIHYMQYSGTTVLCEDEYMFHAMVVQQHHYTTDQCAQVHTCAIAIQNKKPFLVGASVNLAVVFNDKQLTNATTYRCEWSGLVFSGSNSCNPLGFKLMGEQLIPLSVTIYDTNDVKLCTTHTTLNYPSPPPITRSTTSTNTNAAATPDEIHTIANPIQRIQIIELLADPLGADTLGTEYITMKNIYEKPIDLTGLAFVLNNKTKKYLSGIIQPNEILQLFNYYPLPNSGGCVALVDQFMIYDQVCYGIYDQTNILTNIPSLKIQTTNIEQEMITLEAEQVDLFKLDLREQELMTKYYKDQIGLVRDQYHTKTNQLYTTYRSINDAKQDYIDKQQKYIDSQNTYIQTLKERNDKNYTYSQRITQLYNNNKDYVTYLRELNNAYRNTQNYLRQQYPTLRFDPELTHIRSGYDVLDISTAITPSTRSSWWRRMRSSIMTLL